MTPHQMAEAYERARLAQMRGQTWDGLRPAEQQTRVEMSLRSLEDSGITALVADLAERATRADEQGGYLAQRDAEIARRIAEHDAEIARLTAAHEAEVAMLVAALEDARVLLTRAHVAQRAVEGGLRTPVPA